MRQFNYEYHVWCLTCQAIGPLVKTKELAKTGWNKGTAIGLVAAEEGSVQQELPQIHEQIWRLWVRNAVIDEAFMRVRERLDLLEEKGKRV